MPSRAPQPATPTEEIAFRVVEFQPSPPAFRSKLRGGHFSVIGVSPSFREEDVFLALGTEEGLAVLAEAISGQKIVPTTPWQLEHRRADYSVHQPLFQRLRGRVVVPRV